MYVDTDSSRKLGQLSGKLLDLLTEIGARRQRDTESAYIRPSDYAKYKALEDFFRA